MDKPLLLLSMPNCGSDWFASCIAKSQKLNYFREFFNPVTNKKYFNILGKAFGSESPVSYQQIAKFDYEMCDEVYQKTWLKEGYNFTKENFSAFKIDFFKEHFNCIALIKDLESVFPPSRQEVYFWYNQIYYSMLEAKMPELSFFEPKNVKEKSVIAFCVYKNKFIQECRKNNIPILESLSKDDLIQVSFLDLESLSKEIEKTRKDKKKDFVSLNCDHILTKLKVLI